MVLSDRGSRGLEKYYTVDICHAMSEMDPQAQHRTLIEFVEKVSSVAKIEG